LIFRIFPAQFPRAFAVPTIILAQCPRKTPASRLRFSIRMIAGQRFYGQEFTGKTDKDWHR
jgi:hypothetical protein